MHASMVHVWEYLTRCGHKFLWLKINPLPPGYTGSVYRAQFEIYSASGRILVTLDVHRQQSILAVNLLIKTGSCLIAVYLWIETSHHIMQNRGTE